MSKKKKWKESVLENYIKKKRRRLVNLKRLQIIQNLTKQSQELSKNESQ